MQSTVRVAHLLDCAKMCPKYGHSAATEIAECTRRNYYSEMLPAKQQDVACARGNTTKCERARRIDVLPGCDLNKFMSVQMLTPSNESQNVE